MAELFAGLKHLEEARTGLTGPSFMAGVFVGRPDFALLLPPEESERDRATGDVFCQRIEQFLRDHVDPEEIERTAKIPENVLQGLLDLGAFGMKIPAEYGGLGLSYANYGRVLTRIASWSNILALTVAVPQSIGIAMPILLFGTREQQQTYLPLAARQAISAFALTEPRTGSDAANIQTEAVLDASGSCFLVNGEKLWCTNGPLATFVTLIVRVPAKHIEADGTRRWIPVRGGVGAEARVHTALILDMRLPGVAVRQRCQFEGCHGIENAHFTLTNVRVPVENVIGEVGKGLRYALTILNVGRAISIPAICLGMAKQAWQPTLDQANSRITFQAPLATRHTQKMRLGRMAADLFAMEALSSLVWRLADQQRYDIRIEAAVVKICCSEKTIQFVRQAQILFGGLGYETADSKRRRGEPAFPMEQLVRDAEMYRIGEGATDILRPFVAREGLNPHLERAARFLCEGLTPAERANELRRLIRYYVPWYGSQWRRNPLPAFPELHHPDVAPKLIYLERASRRFARAIWYAMAFHREQLRDDQGRQNRIEMVSEAILTIAATALYAESQMRKGKAGGMWDLVNEVFRAGRREIDRLIPEIIHNQDRRLSNIGERAAKGRYGFLNHGIIGRGLREYGEAGSQQS